VAAFYLRFLPYSEKFLCEVFLSSFYIQVHISYLNNYNNIYIRIIFFSLIFFSCCGELFLYVCGLRVKKEWGFEGLLLLSSIFINFLITSGKNATKINFANVSYKNYKNY
jgi:hypothetical protein